MCNYLIRRYSNRPVGRAVTRSSLKREVWGSNLRPVKSDTGCQRLATTATFFLKELCSQGAMTQRWAPQIHYTLWRGRASTIKHLVWEVIVGHHWVKVVKHLVKARYWLGKQDKKALLVLCVWFTKVTSAHFRTSKKLEFWNFFWVEARQTIEFELSLQPWVLLY